MTGRQAHGRCTHPGCTKVSVLTRGWCTMHHTRWLRTGRLDRSWDLPFEERLSLNIDKRDTGCWIWTAGLTSQGYGACRRDGSRTKLYVHRVMYELHVGPIPDGHEIDHLCRVRACCNPAHLEAVVPWLNNMRGISVAAINAIKTHCPQGHMYSAENTINSGRGRQCRACKREYAKRRWVAEKASRCHDGKPVATS